MFPIALYVEPEAFRNLPHFKSIVWLGLIVLTLFQYFLSMVIFLNVLTRVEATQAGLANYLIPFFGVLIAALVLHERLTTFMVAGRSPCAGKYAFGHGLRGETAETCTMGRYLSMMYSKNRTSG